MTQAPPVATQAPPTVSQSPVPEQPAATNSPSAPTRRRNGPRASGRKRAARDIAGAGRHGPGYSLPRAGILGRRSCTIGRAAQGRGAGNTEPTASARGRQGARAGAGRAQARAAARDCRHPVRPRADCGSFNGHAVRSPSTKSAPARAASAPAQSVSDAPPAAQPPPSVAPSALTAPSEPARTAAPSSAAAARAGAKRPCSLRGQRAHRSAVSAPPSFAAARQGRAAIAREARATAASDREHGAARHRRAASGRDRRGDRFGRASRIRATRHVAGCAPRYRRGLAARAGHRRDPPACAAAAAGDARQERAQARSRYRGVLRRFRRSVRCRENPRAMRRRSR